MTGAPRLVAGRLALAGATILLAAAAMLSGCRAQDAVSQPQAQKSAAAVRFPAADRPVSQIVGYSFSSEPKRDSLGEATVVMDLAGIGPGMTVADIGAGEGYYTVRLGTRVGKHGRVLAEDIDRTVVERLGDRVQRERLENVSIRLGTPSDPRLPAASFDRILLVHMYHEVSQPYAFLWNLRAGLKPQGRVVVVELDQAPDRHGMPPALLFCEFSSLGLRLARFVRKPELQGYLAEFEISGARPEPAAIRPCSAAGVPKAPLER